MYKIRLPLRTLFAHCFVNMAQDCFVRYMQGFGTSPLRWPMMPLDTHTPCSSNSYKCSPLGKHTFIEELFNHAGCCCCCCCWPGTTSGPWSSPLLSWCSRVGFRGFNVVLLFSACLESNSHMGSHF